MPSDKVKRAAVAKETPFKVSDGNSLSFHISKRAQNVAVQDPIREQGSSCLY